MLTENQARLAALAQQWGATNYRGSLSEPAKGVMLTFAQLEDFAQALLASSGHLAPAPAQVALQAIRLYDETHPRPTHVTQTQAADMLDCGRGKVAKLLRDGTLKLNKCGLIPIEMIDAARSAGSSV